MKALHSNEQEADEKEPTPEEQLRGLRRIWKIIVWRMKKRNRAESTKNEKEIENFRNQHLILSMNHK